MAKNNRIQVATASPKTLNPADVTGDQKFEQQLAKDRAEIEQHNEKNRDKLGEAATEVYKDGFQFYHSGKTWPFLMPPSGIQLYVTRYYPIKKVALDIFTDKTVPMIAREIEFKKKAFAGAGNTEGITYCVMDYKDKVSDFVAQIGL